MANRKISDLADAAPLLTSDSLLVARGSAPPNLKTTVAAVLALGGVGGSGTINKIPIWTSPGVLGNSALTQSAGSLTSSGNFSVESKVLRVISSEAAGVTLGAINSAVSAGASAIMQVTTAVGGGDPYVRWTSGQAYALGIDVTDSDKFVGSVGVALGTANWLEVDSSGDALFPGQLSAGSGPTLLTTATGLLRHQAINPAIAGTGLSNASGVLSVDAHAPTPHTIASHSDTSATGGELDTLTGGGSADGLHTHSMSPHTIASHTDTSGTGAELDELTAGSETTLHSHAGGGLPAHTIASHSDTSGTGAELNTLTNDSMADTLHRHSELSASDGSPNPALSMDDTGNVTLTGNLLVPSVSVTGSSGPTIPMGIIQGISVGSKVALRIQQDDISEGFIDFVGSDRGVIGPPVVMGSFRVEINGVVRVLAYYADQ